jgi:hypothetical protein
MSDTVGPVVILSPELSEAVVKVASGETTTPLAFVETTR